MENRVPRIGAAIFDLAVISAFFAAASGLLHYTIDVRRMLLLVGGLAAWKSVPFRAESRVVKLLLVAWEGLQTRRGRWTALALVALWGSITGVFQALALRFPQYDVGLFHQIIWNIAHGNGFQSTISRAGNFLLDHLSLTLAFFAPFFWITGDSPLTLPVLHPLLLMGGVAAWVWFAGNAPGLNAQERNHFASMALLGGVFFDSLWGNRTWGFHENALAFATSSWAFALFFADPASSPRAWRRKALILGLFLISAASKEILLLDTGLALACWSAYAARERRWREALPLLALTALLVALFVRFEALPHPADKNYFDRYYGYLGHGLGDFLRTLVLSPGVVFQTIGARELARYFWVVFAPWLFIPLLRLSSFPWLLAIAPSFFSCALSTFKPLRFPNYHYALELWPLLAVLTLLTFARIRSFRLVWAWVAFMAFASTADPFSELRDFAKVVPELSAVRKVLSEIPPEASVASDELTGTWLAGRKLAARIPDFWIFPKSCPEWIVGKLPSDTTATNCRYIERRTLSSQNWSVFQKHGQKE